MAVKIGINGFGRIGRLVFQAICDQGNGQTGCLVGKLVHILSTGTVGPGSGSGTGTKALGVQLIK